MCLSIQDLCVDPMEKPDGQLNKITINYRHKGRWI